MTIVQRVASALLVLALVSCDAPGAGNGAVEQRHVSSSDCDNADAVAKGEGRGEGSLWADLDQDGTDDEVYIAYDKSGDAGCQSFLVVDSGPVVYTAAVDPSGTPRALLMPHLNSLAQIDGKGGPEIVVDVEAGASTRFLGVFILSDSLERLSIKGRGPGPFSTELSRDDLFPFGGSVGHMEGVDCTDGKIHMVAAVPVGDSADVYRVENRFFDIKGTAAVLDRSLTTTEKRKVSEVADLPGMAASPFGSCKVSL